MFSLGSSHRFYLHQGHCDMRKSFDGLCGLISSEIDFLKITDKFWDTEHQDYYFQKDNLIENLSIPAGKLNGLKDLFIDKPGFDLADLTPQLLDAIILNQIANVETFVDNYKFLTISDETGEPLYYQNANTIIIEIGRDKNGNYYYI